ncbi:MAG: response regulator transcription factor [Bacteroidia bacterium]|nr:response regulator transcription factor [Bacteroidia bacterium]
MLKVLIADDHEIVRRGIIQILKEEFSFLEIGEASDTSGLINKAISENWDIIISDIAMPGGGGIKAFSEIKEKRPLQKFLFISIYPEEQYALRLITAGASGFVKKDTAPEENCKRHQNNTEWETIHEPGAGNQIFLPGKLGGKQAAA